MFGVFGLGLSELLIAAAVWVVILYVVWSVVKRYRR